ncbi:hypothetical protein ABIC03_003189 [Bradyrhizobium sp. RT6a]
MSFGRVSEAIQHVPELRKRQRETFSLSSISAAIAVS